jgi:hypothetical protein
LLVNTQAHQAVLLTWDAEANYFAWR